MESDKLDSATLRCFIYIYIYIYAINVMLTQLHLHAQKVFSRDKITTVKVSSLGLEKCMSVYTRICMYICV